MFVISQVEKFWWKIPDHRRPLRKWALNWLVFCIKFFVLRFWLVLEFVLVAPAVLWTILCLVKKSQKVYLTGNGSNISGFIPGIEQELRRRSFEVAEMKKMVIVTQSPDPNLKVRHIYDQIVTIVGSENRIKRRLYLWAYRLGVRGSVLVENKSDPSWEMPSNLWQFSSTDIDVGARFLESYGIDSDDQFACYAIRTESYYLRQIERGVKLLPRTVRNPVESNYLKVVSDISTTKFPVIRMGKDIESAIDPTLYPNVIDYASKHRSDFLDVFLLSKCKFLLLGNTGLFWIRAMFQKPTVHCDLYDVRHQVISGDIMIFQKLWLKNEQRLATVSEMLKIGGFYSKESHQGKLGVELVKNTPEEIFSVCNEIDSRIDGNWSTTRQDEELQQKYLDLLLKFSNKPSWRGGGRVGTQFLRDNQDLLK